jgi:ATP-binding cassette subfamily B protein
MFNFHLQSQIHYSVKSILSWQLKMSRDNRLQAVLNTALGILSVLSDFAFIWATKMAIDIATPKNIFTNTSEAAHHAINYVQDKQGLTLWDAGLILIGLIVLQILISIASRWVSALLGVKAQNRMQRKMFAHILQSQWTGLEKYHSGDVINRLESDVSNIVTLLTSTIPDFVTVCFQLVGAFIFLYFMDPTLALVSVLISPFFIALSRLYIHKMRAINKDVRQTDSKVQSLLQETVQHRMIIKILERNKTMESRLGRIQEHLQQQIKNKTKITVFSSTLLNVGFSAVYLIAFLWAASRMQQGIITYGSMAAFLQLVGKVQGPLRSLTSFIPTFIGNFTASERLMELEEIPLESSEPPIRFTEQTGIRLQNVSFSYGPNEKPVLNDFSCDFKPGSTTAILGKTGVGKTTLIRLLLALIHPTSGTVEIYSDRRTVEASTLTRCNFIYVPQGNTLFSGTIRDNLALGNPDATEDEMRKVLHIACADFVFTLPEQLDTPCGELGGGLSEGQAQRIAIARALLRDGNLLLLDEATSALDIDTERQLLDNLETCHRDKTVIFITHRQAIVSHCDNILHMEE